MHLHIVVTQLLIGFLTFWICFNLFHKKGFLRILRGRIFLLVNAPFVIGENIALVGFKETEWNEAFGLEA